MKLGHFVAMSSLLLCCATASANGEIYMGEAGIGYFRAQYNTKTYLGEKYELEGNTANATAAINFGRVDTTGLPLGEARFLKRTGEARVTVDQTRLESQWGPNNSTDTDVTGSGLFVEYMSSLHPLYVSASYNRNDYEGKSKTLIGTFKTKYDTEETSAGIGFFAMDHLLLGISGRQSTFNSTDFVESDTRGYDAFFKYIWLGGDGNAVHLLATYGQETEEDDFGTKTDSAIVAGMVEYFFTRQFSTSLGMSNITSDIDENELRGYLLMMEYFFVPGFSAEAYYNTYRADDNPLYKSADQLGITVKARF